MRVLVINLYDASNDIQSISRDDELFVGLEKNSTGDKNVWLGEEFMIVEL